MPGSTVALTLLLKVFTKLAHCTTLVPLFATTIYIFDVVLATGVPISAVDSKLLSCFSHFEAPKLSVS